MYPHLTRLYWMWSSCWLNWPRFVLKTSSTDPEWSCLWPLLSQPGPDQKSRLWSVWCCCTWSKKFQGDGWQESFIWSLACGQLFVGYFAVHDDQHASCRLANCSLVHVGLLAQIQTRQDCLILSVLVPSQRIPSGEKASSNSDIVPVLAPGSSTRMADVEQRFFCHQCSVEIPRFVSVWFKWHNRFSMIKRPPLKIHSRVAADFTCPTCNSGEYRQLMQWFFNAAIGVA